MACSPAWATVSRSSDGNEFAVSVLLGTRAMLLGRVYTGACKHDGLVLVLKKNVAEKKVVHYFLLINTGKVYRARVFTGRVVCRPTNQKIPESFRVACPWGYPFPFLSLPLPFRFPSLHLLYPFPFHPSFPSFLHDPAL